jgi:hypothetical protein
MEGAEMDRTPSTETRTGDGSSSDRQPGTLPILSLPKSRGATRGIGEKKFAATAVTDTGSLTVPIATGPGRLRLGPHLLLCNDCGCGNGSFGLGWSLAPSSITRHPNRRLPRSETVTLSRAEDLAPVLVADRQGNGCRQTRSRIGDTIVFYRRRIQERFARIEHGIRRSDGDP